jgi:predicted alpha/beta hydrolase family esterase
VIDSPRTTTVIVPGIDNSGPRHWQTLLEQDDPQSARLEPYSWTKPQLDDWLSALDRAVDDTPGPPVLVAHSLGTLLVAHWAAASSARVLGALLVAIPDPAAPEFPALAPTFRNPPTEELPFPSIVVASSDDPYDPAGAAREFAQAWGSRFVDAGPAGHINTRSGYGDWPLARTLIADLRYP